MASKLQELLRSVSKKALETPCSDEHIVEIAHEITSWQPIAPYLGLTAVEEESIVQNHHDVRIQRREMLRTWKKKLGSKATYRCLAKALYKAKRVIVDLGLVEKVVELLTEEPAATGSLELDSPSCMKDTSSHSGVLPKGGANAGRHSPSLRELDQLPDVATIWYRLGLQLGVRAGELDMLEKNYPRDANMCKIKMFAEWRRGDTNPTYEKLVRALAAVGNRKLAESVCSVQGISLSVLDATDAIVMNQSHEEMESDAVTAAKTNIEYLQNEYEQLVTMTQEAVKAKSTTLAEFRTKITLRLPEPRPEQETSLMKKLQFIYDAKSIDEIFGIFNLCRLWDYLNFGLLQHLVDVYGGDELQQRMLKYTTSVEAFRKKTTLKVFWKAYPITRKCPEIPTNFRDSLKRITFKHGKLDTTTTLNDIERYRQELAEQYSFSEFTIILADIEKGCVATTWLVPSSLAAKLADETKKGNVGFLEQHNILELKIQESTVYRSALPTGAIESSSRSRSIYEGILQKRCQVSEWRVTNNPTHFIERRQLLKDSMSIESSSRTRSICEGILQKRCQMSWRPRYVELLLDPTDFSGRQYSFQLMFFDPRRRMLKDKIRMADIVTIRANQDCYFQIFLANGKILQLKADSIENEAYWIAMLKVGLGRGSIFYVRVNTLVSNLDHALLYSIGVNLPAHRMGQLDRVLILTSPINEVNIHAWDLNRVKTFMELEVGIRIELCSTCLYNQPSMITLVMERQFIKDCISFLCRETRISQKPSDEKGIPTYYVDHKCGYLSPPPKPAPPPPNHAPPPPNSAPPPPAYSETDPELSSKSDSQLLPQLQLQSAQQSSANYVNVHDAVEETEPASEVEPPLLSHTVARPSPANPRAQPPVSSSEAQGPAFDFTDKDWDAFSDSGSHASDDDETSYPPRNIARKNYECSIPAIAQPYLNFQPYLFSSGSTHFEVPYQISSRIIVTDSGEVQYERNILGSMPMAHSGFHFKKQVPLPPRRMQQSQTTHPPSSKERLWHSSPKLQPQQPFSSNPGSQAIAGVYSTPESPTVLPKMGKKTQVFRTISDQTSHPQSRPTPKPRN